MKTWVVLGLALALAGCGRGKSTGEWIEQLKDHDSAQRLHAIKALQAKGDGEEVVPALAEALQDENAFVRRDAALALGNLGPEARSAAAALQAALHDRNAGVRRAAAAALEKVDPSGQARDGVH